MSFFWIYDIPNWLLGLLTTLGFVAVSVAALVATRGAVRRVFGPPPGHNDAVSYYLGAFGVFYGLTIGLIAVATWQNLADLEHLVAQEAATLRVLDMNVNWYPSPVREDLHRRILDYTDYVIDEEWPAQKRGITPGTSLQRVLDVGRPLATFEPSTAGQATLHEETVRLYTDYLELRRQRIYHTTTGLPATVWYVLLAGAALSIGLTLLFSLPSLPAHLVLTVVLAGFVGLLIFLIAAMDHPFRGEFSVGPDAFELVRQQMVAQASLRP